MFKWPYLVIYRDACFSVHTLATASVEQHMGTLFSERALNLHFSPDAFHLLPSNDLARRNLERP